MFKRNYLKNLIENLRRQQFFTKWIFSHRIAVVLRFFLCSTYEKYLMKRQKMTNRETDKVLNDKTYNWVTKKMDL